MATCKHEELAPMVRDLYIEGFTKNKISQLLKVDQALIGYILYVQLKIHERYPRKQTGEDLLECLPKEKVAKIITLASFGYTNKEIATDQELPHRDVNKIIFEAKRKKLIKKFC
jgi:hypothetical protein